MLGAKGPGDQLTLPVMCEAIVALVRERVALAAALKGSKTVVAQVGSVLGVIIHIVFVFLYLLVYVGGGERGGWEGMWVGGDVAGMGCGCGKMMFRMC